MNEKDRCKYCGFIHFHAFHCIKARLVRLVEPKWKEIKLK
jgi:hypothetical protein